VPHGIVGHGHGTQFAGGDMLWRYLLHQSRRKGGLNQSEAACQTIPANQTGKNAYGFTVNVRSKCLGAADAMYEGLQEFGSKAFNKRREQMCQCC
jgi:hypothetical protein